MFAIWVLVLAGWVTLVLVVVVLLVVIRVRWLLSGCLLALVGIWFLCCFCVCVGCVRFVGVFCLSYDCLCFELLRPLAAGA